MARILGVETFFTEEVALVRVRTEDGHEGWLLDELITRRIGPGELNDAFDALRAGQGALSVLVLD